MALRRILRREPISGPSFHPGVLAAAREIKNAEKENSGVTKPDGARQSNVMTTPATVQPSRDIPPDLLCDAQRGDHAALESIVRAFHIPIRRFLVVKTGDLSLADDLAQEVFISAFQSLDRLRDSTRLESWLFAIARNKCMDHFRSTARRQKTLEGLLQVAIGQADCVPERELRDDSEERLEFLRHCLEQLSGRARQFIDQYYFEGQTAEEMGKRNDRQGSSIRMALLRIRRNLADCIRRKLGEQV